MNNHTPVVLTIAGSDSSAGAGIQADLKTFSALGVYGATVITAITAQNTQKITSVYPLPASVIEAQLCAVFEDLNVVAVKTGMLCNRDIIEIVCQVLTHYRPKSLVVDPVLAASTGNSLMVANALDALTTRLFPLATLITPNLPEAAILLNSAEIETYADMLTAINRLELFGAQAVLLKGGHLPGESCHDILLDQGAISTFSHTRIHTTNTHGTGCTLASAIAAGLAVGKTLVQATSDASAYVHSALTCADQLSVGSGPGPLQHFFKDREFS